ncbi:MAG: hypothetical protein KatS3mg005_3419 [Bryobacteraceae bacterium]|jgi:hypothetical protein|nr:MAG: hypothetical protein KatS3mg005_3419 [Bryobacteraceae bacterium]
MSDIYFATEQAVLDMLRQAPGLAMVKTFEADIREAFFSGESPARGFNPGELPAVNVSAVAEPCESEPFTAGEIRYQVPVTVVIVTRHQDKGLARSAARAIQWEVEKLVHQARRSANPLGPNSVVTGPVRSSLAVIQDRPAHFGLAQVDFTVTKVVPL